MLNSQEGPAVQAKIEAECTRHGSLRPIVDFITASPLPFRLLHDASGLTLAPGTQDEPADTSGPRERLKLFFPEPETLVVIFYKVSAISFSRDRYSYGGVASPPTAVTEPQVERWLTFLASGFDSTLRPNPFQRTFPYDLPDE